MDDHASHVNPGFVMRKLQAAFLIFSFAFVAGAGTSAFAQDTHVAQDGPLQAKVQGKVQPARPDEPLVRAKHGMVVSAQHLATRSASTSSKKAATPSTPRSRSATRWQWCTRAAGTSAAAAS
jgi:hypothetical protein